MRLVTIDRDSDLPIREVVPVMSAVMADLHEICMDGPWDEPPWPTTAWQSLLADPAVYATVVERAGTPCGFAVGRTVMDEGEVLGIGVVPTARRSGIGGRLAADLLERAATRGAERVFLEVAEPNRAARALYHRLGFHSVGRRRHYYRAPDSAIDALTLAISLGPGAAAALTDGS